MADAAVPAVVEDSFENSKHGTQLLGMEFAPLHVPLERRLQTFGVFHQMFVLFILPFITFFILFFTSIFMPPVAIGYAIWLWWDWDSPAKGAYPSKWFKNMRIHKWFCDYFPIRFHATADLPPDQNYLIGVHPHGIIVHSAYQFMCNGTGIADRFPNISFHICTLVSNFYAPLRREWIMLHGAINCSKESLQYVLGGAKKGEAAVLIVGGAEEALEANPGRHVLTLARRKGFVKLAIQTGAQLVPCFAFGENDLYVQAANEKGTPVRRFQEWVKKVTTFSAPFFHGRGILNYTFGMLPYRKELNTVLGAPIAVEKNENPSQEQIDSLHALYIQKLTDLFEEHKEKYGVEKDNHLIIQ